MTFPLFFHDGHPLVQFSPDLILLDTGSPLSFHDTAILRWMGTDHPAKQSMMGVDMTRLRQMLGLQITGLMGMDIIGKYSVVFDYPSMQVHFEDDPLRMDGTILPLSTFMDVPMTRVEILGAERPMYLDTGAKLSYIDAALTAGRTPDGHEDDFHPSVGNFSTAVHRLEGLFCGQTFDARFGNLPPALGMLLSMGGSQGVLGYDFFNRFRVGMDVRNQQMIISG
jgi:hypothetical protein